MLLTPEEGQALLLSLRIAGWATFWGMIAATAFAWLLARHRFPGRVLLDALLHAPLILPPVVIGFVLLMLFGAHRADRAMAGCELGDQAGLHAGRAALAAGVSAFPLMLRAVRQAIEAVDPRLEEAARSLGAGHGTARSPSSCRWRCPD